MKLFKFFIVFVILQIGICNAAEITIAWDPNEEKDLGGYGIYMTKDKEDPPTLFSYIPVGELSDASRPTVTVTDLEPSSTYTFYTTAYDKDGNESTFSEPIRVNFEGISNPVVVSVLSAQKAVQNQPMDFRKFVTSFENSLANIRNQIISEATKSQKEIQATLSTSKNIQEALMAYESEIRELRENYKKGVAKIRGEYQNTGSIDFGISTNDFNKLLTLANLANEIKGRNDFENRIDKRLEKIEDRQQALTYFVWGIFVTVITLLATALVKTYKKMSSYKSYDNRERRIVLP